MRAIIRGTEVEGTPEEIAQLHALLNATGKPIGSPGASPTKRFVPAEVMFRMVKRRSISDAQRNLLKTLRDNHPEWTSAKQLQQATGYNANQLSGLLGAFGKRVASTEGFEQGMVLFDYEWSYDEDCYLYRLSDDTLQGVLRAKL